MILEDSKQYFKKILSYKSSLALILSNLVPILGVLFWGWDLRSILFIYWAESAIIGFFTILKMILVKDGTLLFMRVYMVCFFIIHFGLFMAVHASVLILITSSATFGMSLESAYSYLPELFQAKDLWFAFLGLFLSHLISFITNFIFGEEKRKTTTGRLFTQPYVRIGIMHVTIVFGSFLSLILKKSIGILIFLVLVKTGVDLVSHLKERDRLLEEQKKEKEAIQQRFLSQQIFKSRPWLKWGVNILFLFFIFEIFRTIIGMVYAFFVFSNNVFPFNLDKWKKYNSRDGKYSYSYPQGWFQEEELFKDENGAVLAFDSILEEEKDNPLKGSFIVTYYKQTCDIPIKNYERILSQLNFSERVISGVGAKLYSGNDSFSSPNQPFFRKMVYLEYKDFCYFIDIFNDQTNIGNSETDKVLDSFRFNF